MTAAPYWVDTDEAIIGIDQPLHSGVLTDGVRGNLLRALQESAYDVSGFIGDGYSAVNVTTAVIGEWSNMSNWNRFPVPIRRRPDGTFRDLKVSLEGHRSSVGATATVRIYADAPSIMVGDPDTTNAYPDTSQYTDLEFTTGSYVRDTGTISPIESTFAAYSPTNAIDGTRPGGQPFVMIAIIAKSTALSDTIYIRGLRVAEVVE